MNCVTHHGVGSTNSRSPDELPVYMLFELDRAADRLINKASQLIDDQTANISECYMSVRSNMDDGKQVNRIQSEAFQHRCMVAGLRLTLGPGWIAETCELLFGSCSNVMSTFTNTRKGKHEKDVKCKLTQTYKKLELRQNATLEYQQLQTVVTIPMQHSLTQQLMKSYRKCAQII